jgi:hypothetical protein
MAERIFRVMRGDVQLYETHINEADTVTFYGDTVTVGMPAEAPPEEELSSADSNKRAAAVEAIQAAAAEGASLGEPAIEVAEVAEPVPEPEPEPAEMPVMEHDHEHAPVAEEPKQKRFTRKKK